MNVAEIIPFPPQTSPISVARQRGRDAHKAGISRKAVPPEYRHATGAAEVDAWTLGWDLDAEQHHIYDSDAFLAGLGGMTAAEAAERKNEPMSVKHEEPTAAEKLAVEIADLQEDVAELRDRLDGRKPRNMEHVREERAQRWKRTLAIVEAALAEKRH